SNISLSDDTVSCDHDGFLDPGEIGTLHLSVANSGLVAAGGVTVTATTTTPGVILGPRIDVGSIAARTQIELAVPVQISPSAPLDAMLDLAVEIDSDAGFGTSNLVVERRAPIGVDEKLAVATVDHVETTLTAWTPTGDTGRWSRISDSIGNHLLLGTESP